MPPKPLSLKLGLAVIGALLGAPPWAEATPTIDCPLRDQPYSVDSPLIDILLSPAAKAAASQVQPSLGRLPASYFSTTPPTFAAIMTIRELAAYAHVKEEQLDAINQALQAVPVTEADRTARCARYDVDAVRVSMPSGRPRLLLFQKITGFREGPSVDAAEHLIRELAQRNGWALIVTDKGGAIRRAVLKQFDVVIWNNVSGDVLTLSERSALRQYVEQGGGFVAFHGSGGDPVYYWDWYVDTLIGARFEGHPMKPQFQEARIDVADPSSPLVRDLAPGWTMTDEWYSFKTNPRARGAHVLATLDESSYSPIGLAGEDLHMGDHPIAWTQCVGAGRSFYSAIGHRPETYSDPHYSALLQQAILWAAPAGKPRCS